MQKIPNFDRDEIQDYVVARTTGGVGRDDILFAVCEQHGLTWPQAEALVDEILLESSREVTLKRNVVYGGISFSTFIVGLVLAVVCGYHLAKQLALYPFEKSGVTWNLLVAVIVDNYQLLAGFFLSAVLIVVGLWWFWRMVGDFFLALIEPDAGF